MIRLHDSVQIRSLFQQLTPDSEIGRRFADQLVRVYQKSGDSIILLIHLEVQAEPEPEFPKRMFTYVIRLPM